MKFENSLGGIQIQVSEDGSSVRARYSFYSALDNQTHESEPTDWTEIEYEDTEEAKPYFVFAGRKQYLDDYPRI